MEMTEMTEESLQAKIKALGWASELPSKENLSVTVKFWQAYFQVNPEASLAQKREDFAALLAKDLGDNIYFARKVAKAMIV